MPPRAAVILAAGQGTRMRSPLPKVLHPVGGRAMLDRAIDTAEALGCERVVTVVGTHSPEVGAHAAKRLGQGAIAVQDPPLGTGHAVRAAEGALSGFEGVVVVTYADCPLLEAASVEPLFAALAAGADVAVLGFEAADPGAYGRLVTGADGSLERIVEAKEASPEELAISLCNSGVMAADWRLMASLLAEVTNANAKGEYYLTDVVALARARGLACHTAVTDEAAVMGANSQAELAACELQFQRVARERLMEQGVRMPAPDTVPAEAGAGPAG